MWPLRPQVSCREGYGLCGTVPENALVQFVVAPPPASALWPAAAATDALAGGGRVVYLVVGNDVLRTYQQALDFCR